MASVSIQGRVDGDLWESLKEKGETHTELLQRIVTHYVATSGAELQHIAPTPASAIAVLFQSHKQLQMLLTHAQIALPALREVEPVIEPASPTTAINCADEW